MTYSTLSNLLDVELLARMVVAPSLTPLEAELAARLGRALDEIDVLLAEAHVDSMARAGVVERRAAQVRGDGALSLVRGVS